MLHQCYYFHCLEELFQIDLIIRILFNLVSFSYSITTFIAISIFTNTITIYHLIIVSFFQGTFWAFMMPARQSIIAELVDENQLNNAVSLNAAGMSLTTMVSPAIGGLVYHYFGPGMTYVLITFFVLLR